MAHELSLTTLPPPATKDQPPTPLESDSPAVTGKEAPQTSRPPHESVSSTMVGKDESPPPQQTAQVEDSGVEDTEKELPQLLQPPPLQTKVSVEPELDSAELEPQSLVAVKDKEGSEKSAVTTTTTQPEETEEEEEEKRKIPVNLGSFKEESNVIADLSDSERKSLEEFKALVQEALDTHQFSCTSPPATEINPNLTEESPKKPDHTPEEITIWGVPLLEDDRTDVILLKFLRARDFKTKDAFTMIKNTIKWRKEFKIDDLIEEDLGGDLEKVVFMHGHDREGHPVCYNVYGEFQNKDLYQKTFSDEEKRVRFLRWRIQFLERSIRKLDFRPGGVCTIFHVNDLKNSPGPAKKELRLATKQAVQLLQDNYPEFVAKQVFINVPWWYLAFYTMISPFMTQRTKSKFVFAGAAKSAETLFKYASPEQVPIQYGGLSVDYCDCDPDFTVADPAVEITLKPTTKQTVEILIYEKCVIVWEIRVVGWEISYGAEFVPDAKDAYTVIIHKPRKMATTDEPVVCENYKVTELGKLLLIIDNPTSKKKKLLYRFKIEPLTV